MVIILNYNTRGFTIGVILEEGRDNSRLKAIYKLSNIITSNSSRGGGSLKASYKLKESNIN